MIIITKCQISQLVHQPVSSDTFPTIRCYPGVTRILLPRETTIKMDKQPIVHRFSPFAC